MNFALVTGGTRGIGRAISVKLASCGFFVLMNYKSRDEEAIQTLNFIKENGWQGQLLKFDVSNESEVKEKLQKWKNENPDSFIEVLVNNAGITKDKLLMSMNFDDWNSVIATNLNSFFFVTSFVIKDMSLKRLGKIVNIASVSGIRGSAGQTNYSASKAALIGATKALAQEMGKRNIRVNAVAPGFIQTEMTKNQNCAEIAKKISLGRIGKAEEVAEVVAFLVSDAASYVTGEVVCVDGGLRCY